MKVFILWACVVTALLSDWLQKKSHLQKRNFTAINLIGLAVLATCLLQL